ncbi:MAG: DUF4203 domain-containing protein [Caldilinea sp.]|nr:DUF4203 domain-containing protein [Caldilinea sp.]
MGFELFCATLIALLFGAFVCFAGYRFFLVLLPIWGFFFGFGVGAQAVQAFLGQAFLGTVTSWVVGFIVAVLFAVLSYLFYIVAVALMGGSLGYGLAVSLLGAIGFPFGFITWLIGIAVGAVLAYVTIAFNLQKYVIIIATALGGAGLAVGTLLLGVEGMALAEASQNPAQVMLRGSPFMTIVFLVMAIAGIFVQWRASQSFEIEAYENRI